MTPLHRLGRTRSIAALSASLLLGALAACATSEDAEGQDRALHSAQKEAERNAEKQEVTLGEATAGDISVPIRGYIVSPSSNGAVSTQDRSPVVFVSHLRAPNCVDTEFAYPCPTGEQGELRYDRGMLYAAHSLAEAGYAVVIPDLGPTFHGMDLKDPYDQTALWSQIMTAFYNEVSGPEYADSIDANRVGLLVHSRSAELAHAAQEVFGSDHLMSIFAYAPAYDTFDPEAISPAPPDVPYRAIYGDLDVDVDTTPNRWLGNYVTVPRAHTAEVGLVPGFGHMLVNRTAADALGDDRTACGEDSNCPDQAAHEELLTNEAIRWFDDTLSRTDSRSEEWTPPTLAGEYSVRWLSEVPNTALSLGVQDFTGESEDSEVCTFPDPMDPTAQAEACPDPELGVVQIPNRILYTSAATAEGLSVTAEHLALHLAPTGTYETDRTEVEVHVTTADGRELTSTIPSDAEELKNQSSDQGNGVYVLGTVNLDLSEELRGEAITALRVESKDHPIALAGAQFY